MPTTVGTSTLMADRAGGVLLGRGGLTNHYFTTTLHPTTMASSLAPGLSPIDSQSFNMPTPSQAELILAVHTQSSSDDVTAIQTPLLVGLEHSSALIHALLASFSVILVSELGDKTFIITAIMAMKNSRSLVFMSSAFALFLMTVLSVGMGVAVTVIPELYTHYASIVLFLCFGVKMLKEAYDMGADAEGGESEFEEVQRSLEADEKEPSEKKLPDAETANNELLNAATDKLAEPTQVPPEQLIELQHKIQENSSETKRVNYWEKIIETLYVAPIVIKVFTMILVAEWGDRSQISTVILAAREDVVGVFIGSFSGHVLCTGLAVIGGRVVAEIISIRTLTFLGGIIFLFFATFAIVSGPE